MMGIPLVLVSLENFEEGIAAGSAVAFSENNHVRRTLHSQKTP
jgi:hypothetical protein